MRRALLLICVLGVPSASWAQTNPSSWENLNALQPGEKIQVVEMNSKKASGTFVSVSDAAISLQEEGTQQTIPKQDVRSVKLMQNGHRVRNALIVAAVGAGAGAGIGAAEYSKCSPSQSFCIQPVGRGATAGIGAVVGGAAGAIVGALLPSHKTIYHASAR